jgi:hypothetical protein
VHMDAVIWVRHWILQLPTAAVFWVRLWILHDSGMLFFGCARGYWIVCEEGRRFSSASVAIACAEERRFSVCPWTLCVHRTPNLGFAPGYCLCTGTQLFGCVPVDYASRDTPFLWICSWILRVQRVAVYWMCSCIICLHMYAVI